MGPSRVGTGCYPESFRGYTGWPACTKCGSRVLHRVLQSATQGATFSKSLRIWNVMGLGGPTENSEEPRKLSGNKGFWPTYVGPRRRFLAARHNPLWKSIGNDAGGRALSLTRPSFSSLSSIPSVRFGKKISD